MNFQVCPIMFKVGRIEIKAGEIIKIIGVGYD
jgi:hypothetical protein